MTTRHVLDDLCAHQAGILEPSRAREVSEHLLVCPRCRRAFDEVRRASAALERLPLVKAPDSLWASVESALETPVRPRSRRWRWLAAAAVLVSVALGGAFALRLRPWREPSWSVASLAGSPHVGSAYVADEGRLAVGEWLETDAASRARISVGDIGRVDVGPRTRVRLVSTRWTEHRLALERGTLSAVIWAPPRLFFVNTPAAVAVDLGCAYTLAVDDDGDGRLTVTTGWVALEEGGHESYVPSGASCEMRRGVGPGTPCRDDAAPTLRAAVSRLDFEGGGAADLDAVLASARPADGLTLWHLLSRTNGDARTRVHDALAVLAPPPSGVTRDGILDLDDRQLTRWRLALEDTW